jgi:DNA-3-methyladenine glycosylase II
LSDDILASASDEEASQKLQNVQGIGPWSVFMFLLFECHRKDILPIGDLVVRKGTAKLWKVKGKANNGGLCPTKDKDLLESLHDPFAPYRSISSYYMYKLVDVKG